jgi:endonuclease III
MNNLKVKRICSRTIDSHIDRMHYLCELNQHKDAEALYGELKEWIDDDVEHEVLYLDFT